MAAELTVQEKLRIVQELVPGKQLSLAHVIANPDKILYTKLGLDPAIEYAKSAIGIITISPAETAVIVADVAIKAGNIDLSFVDRFSGTVIMTGLVSEVDSAMQAVVGYVRDTLGFTTCPLTRT